MAASLTWLKANLGAYKTTRYEGKTRICTEMGKGKIANQRKVLRSKSACLYPRAAPPWKDGDACTAGAVVQPQTKRVGVGQVRMGRRRDQQNLKKKKNTYFEEHLQMATSGSMYL